MCVKGIKKNRLNDCHVKVEFTFKGCADEMRGLTHQESKEVKPIIYII